MTDWQLFYEQDTPPALADLLRFDAWQEKLAKRITDHAPDKVLEAGCGYGQTGYLLAVHGARITLLDAQHLPLHTARRLFAQQDRAGLFVQGDLMQLPFAGEQFDVVFNAGVLEHFDFSDRCRALAEMVRCVKTGGKVIVALPNHFSRPYRYSYLYRKKRNQWPYPDEHMLYDLRQEVRSTGLRVCQSRETICPETAFHFLRRHQRILFRLASLAVRFEGYLSILTFVKQDNHHTA